MWLQIYGLCLSLHYWCLRLIRSSGASLALDIDEIPSNWRRIFLCLLEFPIIIFPQYFTFILPLITNIARFYDISFITTSKSSLYFEVSHYSILPMLFIQCQSWKVEDHFYCNTNFCHRFQHSAVLNIDADHHYLVLERKTGFFTVGARLS